MARSSGSDRPARGRRGGDVHHASRGHGRFTPYLLIAPAFVIFTAFMLYPLGRAAQLSLYQWDGLSLGIFVGVDNYAKLLTDEGLRDSFAHAFVLIFFYAVAPIVIGLVLAAILNRAKVRGLSMFRTLVFLPQVIAMVVVSVAWNRIYAPDGTLNSFLRTIGLGDLARAWLGDYVLTLPAVGVIGTWVEIGLVTVLLLAGMSRIPTDQYEASQLDGAGAFRQFFSLTLPSLRGEIAVALTLTIVAALKTFDLIYMMTGGGPGGTTTVPSYEVYRQAFELHQIGQASAIGVALTLLIFGINLVINRFADKATS